MAVDIPKLFNTELPEALSRNADEAKSINAKYQMNITGAGSWHLDLTSAGPSVTAGEKPADCTITVASEDFQKLYENPAARDQAGIWAPVRITGSTPRAAVGCAPAGRPTRPTIISTPAVLNACRRPPLGMSAPLSLCAPADASRPCDI